MKFHPYAEIFPLLEGTALEELVLDIKAHGLREKIWTYEGKILDGRNRFNACRKAGIEPEYQSYTGDDPLSFVVSLNIRRRHLTEAQRAIAAARIASLRRGANKYHESLTQTEAAVQLHVSRSSVQRARKVIEKGGEALQSAVYRGDVPLKRAALCVDLPKDQQVSAAASTYRPAPHFAHPHSRGCTTFFELAEFARKVNAAEFVRGIDKRDVANIRRRIIELQEWIDSVERLLPFERVRA